MTPELCLVWCWASLLSFSTSATWPIISCFCSAEYPVEPSVTWLVIYSRMDDPGVVSGLVLGQLVLLLYKRYLPNYFLLLQHWVYTECQAFWPSVRIGTPSLRVGDPHPVTRKRVLLPPPLLGFFIYFFTYFCVQGGDTLACGGGSGVDPFPTKGPTFWYSAYNIISLRSVAKRNSCFKQGNQHYQNILHAEVVADFIMFSLCFKHKNFLTKFVSTKIIFTYLQQDKSTNYFNLTFKIFEKRLSKIRHLKA